MLIVMVEPAANVRFRLLRLIALRFQVPVPAHCEFWRVNIVARLPAPKLIVPLLVKSVPVPLSMVMVLLVLSPCSTPPTLIVRSLTRLVLTLRTTVAPFGMTTVSPSWGIPPPQPVHVALVPQLFVPATAVQVAPCAVPVSAISRSPPPIHFQRSGDRPRFPPAGTARSRRHGQASAIPRPRRHRTFVTTACAAFITVFR